MNHRIKIYIYTSIIIIFFSCNLHKTDDKDKVKDIKISLLNYVNSKNFYDHGRGLVTKRFGDREGIEILIENNSINDIFIFTANDSLSFYPKKVHYMQCEDKTGATDIIDTYEPVKLLVKAEENLNVIFPVELGSLFFYDWIEMDVVYYINDTISNSINLTYRINGGKNLIKIKDAANPCE